MDIPWLRFEAQQCHLRALRSSDETEIAKLHDLGERLSKLADDAEKMNLADKVSERDPPVSWALA